MMKLPPPLPRDMRARTNRTGDWPEARGGSGSDFSQRCPASISSGWPSDSFAVDKQRLRLFHGRGSCRNACSSTQGHCRDQAHTSEDLSGQRFCIAIVLSERRPGGTPGIDQLIATRHRGILPPNGTIIARNVGFRNGPAPKARMKSGE